MAKKRMNIWDAIAYLVLKDFIIEDDDATNVTVKNINTDFDAKRFTVEFTNGDVRNIGFDSKIDIDIDGAALASSHTGVETQLRPTKKRFKNKRRK